jgi:hypothetical protein
MYFADLIATDGHHVPYDTSDPTAPYVPLRATARRQKLRVALSACVSSPCLCVSVVNLACR